MGNNKKGNGKRKSAGAGDSSGQGKGAEASDIGKGRPGCKPKQLKPSSSAPNLESNGAIVDNGRQVEYRHNVREPKCTMDDLKGIDELKKNLLEDAIWPFAHPDNLAVVKDDIPRGVLFTGKPGTGKTSLADGIVSEIRKEGRDVRYYEASCGSIFNSYFGESEKRLQHLFRTAAETAPSVIFFDEIDGLGGKRSESSMNPTMNTIATTFITEMNGVERGQVLIIAATNHRELCDPALLRSGRFDIQQELLLPNQTYRVEILQHYLQKRGIIEDKKVLKKVCANLEGFSGSDLENLVKKSWSNFRNRVCPDGVWRTMESQELTEKLNPKNFQIDLDVQTGSAEVKTEPNDVDIIDLRDDGEVAKEPEVPTDASFMPMEDMTACASGYLEDISNENQHGANPVYDAESANVGEAPIEEGNQDENNGDFQKLKRKRYYRLSGLFANKSQPFK